MKLKLTFAGVVLFALLYVFGEQLHAVLFPEEAAMYAERVRIAEALANF